MSVASKSVRVMAVRAAFDRFTFDRVERTLWREGALIPLTPKAAEALSLLLEEPGALVSKERLRDVLWPDGFVEDGNLTQTIYTLRRVLDPEGDGRAFVETVPRRGYRFAAAVTLVEKAPASALRAEVSRGAIRLRLAVATVAVLVVLAAALVGAAQSRTRLNPGLTGEAAREYALGRYYWDKRTLDATRTSIKYFTDVTRLAPGSGLGYAGLGDAYIMIASHMLLPGNPKQYYDKAEAFAREALAVDPQSGEALTTLGYVAANRDHDRVRAERHFRAALMLRPLHAPAHEFLGALDLLKGNVGEANDELARAAELDPSNSPILTWLGIANYYAHRFEQARSALHQAIDLDGHNKDAMYHLILADERLGRTAEALEMLARLRHEFAAKKHDERQAYGETQHALRALIALRDGDRSLAECEMLNLAPKSKARASIKDNAVLYAAVCMRLGRRADALQWIEIGMRDEETKAERALLSSDPELAELAEDARFKELVS